MTELNQTDLADQREVVRKLMVLESRIARLRRELTKPIDRTNPSPSIENEFDWVQTTSEQTLEETDKFIKEVHRRAGWARYGIYKMRQYETDQAVRKASELFDAAHAEHEEAIRNLQTGITNEPNPVTETAIGNDSTDNKEQA